MSQSLDMPAFGMAGFALSYTILAVSPGPNFLVVAQAGLAGSRRTALSAALGVGIGAALLAAITSVWSEALVHNPHIKPVISIAFSALLLAMGFRLLIQSGRNTNNSPAIAGRRPQFWIGFLTALFNPSTASFLALATGRLDENARASGWVVGVVFFIASAWFATVATFVSIPAASSAYQRFGHVLAGAAGMCLIYFGVSSVMVGGAP